LSERTQFPSTHRPEHNEIDDPVFEDIFYQHIGPCHTNLAQPE
jgi:hypothetical protein